MPSAVRYLPPRRRQAAGAARSDVVRYTGKWIREEKMPSPTALGPRPERRVDAFFERCSPLNDANMYTLLQRRIAGIHALMYERGRRISTF